MTEQRKKRIDIIVRFVLTLSKASGIYIMVMGTVIKFIDKTSTMSDWTEAMLIGAGLIGTKTVVQGMLDRKKATNKNAEE